MKKNIIDDLSVKFMNTDGNFDVPDSERIKIIKSLSDLNMAGRDGRTLLIHSALYKTEFQSRNIY
jgi:hypothetical protein